MVSQLKVNEIVTQSGSTITLGNSGDTVNLGSGASQSLAVNSPNFKVTLSGNVTLTNDANVKITFDTATYNVGSAFDTSTNKFTVPSGGAGKYFFFYKGYMGNSLGYYTLKIYKNGSNVSSFTSYHYANSDNDLMDEHTDVLDLAEGDYIEAYAQTTSGNNTFNSGNSHFGGFKLL